MNRLKMALRLLFAENYSVSFFIDTHKTEKSTTTKLTSYCSMSAIHAKILIEETIMMRDDAIQNARVLSKSLK